MVEIGAVDQNLAFPGQIEALDQFGEGSIFPEPEAPTMPRTSPGSIWSETFLEHVGRSRPVAKRHVPELDVRPFGGGWIRLAVRGGLGRRVQNVAEALDRDLDLLKILRELRQPQDRLRDLRGRSC